MRKIYTLILLLSSFTAFGQSEEVKMKMLEDAREQTERNLRSSLIKFTYSPNTIDESKFDFLNTQGGYIDENGIFSRIQFLDETGWPVINFTDNVDAAITTGAASLQPGGDLGLDLTGAGLTVGIFDQTRPKVDHVEYEGRLTQVDGSTETLSTHSTHVSGTVLGAGINAAARGMAYDATGWSFNWDADVSKMVANAYEPDSKPNGMLLSNHSYSVGVGWESGNWLGNPSISEEEDWRFGFYSSQSAAVDQVAFSRPYYLPVFAAGNDRGESGDGTRPPDGPSDILGPRAVSKNGITVGAVESVLDYQSPQSVVMSSFSSWGPTDDGRVKPDMVAMGVNVFSASIASNGSDSYASQSGTSMAAPNVTGSLFLLQQLYSQRNTGRFMLSSTLKALAIHTTKEAGPAPGPDYMYGWGLLDVEAGAKILINQDGVSQFVREEILGDGETYEFEFVSDGVNPIKATIAWTDPEGSPAGTGLDPTDLMLVNDLDMRIIGEDGTEFFPWTLDPSLQASARGINTEDNFRDNVEKIEINNPSPQKYRLVISHKNELRFDVQQFGLVFTAGVVNGSDETLYWIGEDGDDWNDPQNWSNSLGGSSANKVPGNGTRVVFEGADSGTMDVNFADDAEAFSVNFFGNEQVRFDLNGNNILVSNGFRVSNAVTEIENGNILFSGDGSIESLVELGNASFTDVDLRFQSGIWKIISAGELDNVIIEIATLDIDIVDRIRMGDLSIGSGGNLTGQVNHIEFSGNVNVASGASMDDNITIEFIGESGLVNNQASTDFDLLIASSGTLGLNSDGINSLSIQESEVRLGVPEIDVDNLTLLEGANLNLGAEGEMTVTGFISVSVATDDRVLINSTQAGAIIHNVYRKYCFEDIDITNVNLIGDAIVNLGIDVTLSNAEGWLTEDCDDVLFSNFAFQYACVGAAVTFENLSEGAIDEYEWDFGGLGTSSLAEPIFVFDEVGTYTVSLKVSNPDGFTMFEQDIQITSSDINKPNIVANGLVLTSQQPGEGYQWYANGQLIPGATSRSYEAPGDGSYQVAIFDGACNRVSDPIVVSAIEEDEPELARFGVFVGPIPSDDILNINITNNYTGPITFQLVDLSGRVLVLEEKSKVSQEMNVKMNLPGQNGLYVLRINTNNLTLHKKVIKQ
ncbi:S8 family serine peptidase [Algoriphagus sediminis]|uniref:S8 family serine peptidase n=1 Tax=Algoriphagus sediminis TaxID=3057113 RepID=A0ABT7YH23_9BACT|nr:S8 family serine peptidase [Algoriphagus sediminis]MDN3205810.1 S8 family serine peptidase [Algoriphagus sediminis]